MHNAGSYNNDKYADTCDCKCNDTYSHMPKVLISEWFKGIGARKLHLYAVYTLQHPFQRYEFVDLVFISDQRMRSSTSQLKYVYIPYIYRCHDIDWYCLDGSITFLMNDSFVSFYLTKLTRFSISKHKRINANIKRRRRMKNTLQLTNELPCIPTFMHTVCAVF